MRGRGGGGKGGLPPEGGEKRRKLQQECRESFEDEAASSRMRPSAKMPPAAPVPASGVFYADRAESSLTKGAVNAALLLLGSGPSAGQGTQQGAKHILLNLLFAFVF